MTQPVESMTNRTLSGLFWMSLATGANVVSLLLVTVVLARLLTPADFGLAAAAVMVIGFSMIFAELGIGPALVQRQVLETTHVRTGFTLAFGLGILFYALSWPAAPVIAALFGLAELTPIVRVLALVFPIQGLGMVAESLLQRELRFRCVAGLDTVAVILGYGGVGITLGLLGFAAWALVGAQIAQTCLRTILLLVFRPHPAWPLLDRRACADLLGFGGGFTAGRFSNYLAGQGEHLVLGYWLGPVALGVYGRAYQLMAGPAVLFGNVLDRVLFPAMVQVQDQQKRLADAYRRGSALIALVILPVSAVLILLAPELVGVVLGSEWNAVTLPLQILGVGMLFRTSCKISDSLVRATGAVHRRTWRQTAYAIAVLAGAWIGQPYGVEGVALAVLGTLALNYLLMAHLSLSLAGMSWRTFAAAHIAGFAVAAAIGLPVAVTAHALRIWNVAPGVVLLLSVLSGLPALLAIIWLPRIFLGADGLWMAQKLTSVLFPVASSRLENTREREPGSGHPFVRLTEQLAAEGVRYCRWKSRLDLPRLLSGAGDLDLLVARRDASAFLHVAQRLRFIRVTSFFGPNPPHEVHLYGLDPDSGALLHLHVHLTLGAPHLDQLVLENSSPARIPGLLAAMPVVRPETERMLTQVRARHANEGLRFSSLAFRARNGAERLVHGRGNPKRLPGGGLVMAIIGPDASGKSTMVDQTRRWLGSVFRVQVAHLGKPPSTWVTWLPNVAGRLLGRVAPGLRSSRQYEGSRRRGLLYRVRAVLLAWDRRALALRLARKALRGWIVVCDRYPSAVVGAPDSARLKAPELEKGLPWLHAALAQLENRLYREIPRPHVVVRLNAPLNVAIERNRARQKPGKEADDFVARRHRDFFAPNFAGTPILELDTSSSQAKAVRMFRRLLWDWLYENSAACASERETPAGSRRCLVVEFIGVTGAGKSTLIAAVAQFLSSRGLRVCDAEKAILASYGLAFLSHAKLRSALTFLLGLPAFGRFSRTPDGARLSRLALGSIGRGMGTIWTGASLFRNFMKRVGTHLLLERLRGEMDDYDIIIWDEGVVHAAHNLFVHAGTEPNREEVEKFGQLVPKPDLLIWVTAPTAQSASVLLWRGHSRVRATSSAARTFAEHAQITFEVLSGVRGLRERIYQVDNSVQAVDPCGAAIRGRARAIGEFLIQQLHEALQCRHHAPRDADRCRCPHAGRDVYDLQPTPSAHTP